MDTWVDQRVSHPRGNLSHFYGAFLLGFLWPIISLFLDLSLYWVYFKVLPCVCTHLLAKMVSSEEAYGWFDITNYEVMIAKEPFWACVVGKVSLTLRIRYKWSFISYLGRAQLLSPAIMEYMSTREKLQLLSLGPIYLPPEYRFWQFNKRLSALAVLWKDVLLLPPLLNLKILPSCSFQVEESFILVLISSVQFSCSVVSDSATPWTAAHQASLFITNSRSLPKPMSIESVMPSNHFILCRPLLLLPSIFPSIRVFSNKSVLCIMWPKNWSFSFNISPSNEHPRLISFRMDWLDLLVVQRTLKSLLQHHVSKALLISIVKK